jgi:hypothetical protein
MANILERLTEGTVFADKKRESAALVEKWEASGLLEGLDDDYRKSTMSVLLENQAKELLREANAMSAGEVQGFASVAFPIVRRVFAGLIANDLVSVQPMSLPSGLVFFLDFKFGNDVGIGDDKVRSRNESIYGDRVGQEIRRGVRLDGLDAEGRMNSDKGYRNLSNGYGNAVGLAQITAADFKVYAYGDLTGSATADEELRKAVRYDPDLLSDPDLNKGKAVVYEVDFASLGAEAKKLLSLIPENDVYSLSVAAGTVATGSARTVPAIYDGGNGWAAWNGKDGAAQAYIPSALQATWTANVGKVVHRLTKLVEKPVLGNSTVVSGSGYAQVETVKKVLQITFVKTAALQDSKASMADLANVVASDTVVLQFPIKDSVDVARDQADAGLGVLTFQQPWALENTTQIPEIQLKVDSFSITARSRKLKASWTPELGQDLNAYHNLDAEVELTSILSEQIGLEIDSEILNDLVKGAVGATKYWSRRPGKFLDRKTGSVIAPGGDYAAPPDFFGNVSMWYETLLETINDVSADIHRKTLRGAANFIVVSPEVANILEFTAGFRATVTHDSEKGSTGAVKVGALNSKFDVIVDPNFYRNVILVGRKGASFLESGYVYAPYVPLQTTPTIFDPQDFSPRKAVMTRYAKTMVRPDMYGLVVVTDLNG